MKDLYIQTKSFIMKKDNKTPRSNRLAGVVLILASLLLSGNFVSCRSGGEEQANVTVNGPVMAPVAMAFMDANKLLAAKVPNLTLTLIDDSGRVVTPNGLSFTTLNLSGGFVSMALKDSTVFNSEKPYRFAIKAEAPGYSTNYQTVVITQDKPQYIPVFMVKTDDPPPGVAAFKGKIAVSGSKIRADLSVIPNLSKLKKGKVSVKFARGTILLSNKEPIKDASGDVAYTFSFGSPADSVTAVRTFPGGQLITDALDSNGKVLATPAKPFLFTSAGWITLEMTSGKQKVTEFSTPVELSLPIGEKLVNPTTSKPYRAGDRIPMWSLNDRCVWKQEGTAVVKNSSDGLIGVVQIKHLSTWNMDYPTNQCTTPVNIMYNNSGPAFTAYCEVIAAGTGAPYGSHPFMPQNFSAGSGTIQLIKGGQNVPGVFVVYDNPTGPGNVVASSNFTFCDPTVTPSVLNLGGPLNSVTVDFLVQAGSMQYPLCKNAVFYQNASFCGGSTVPNFGGFLAVNTTTNTGEVVLSQTPPFLYTCIQLFYAGNAGGLTIGQSLYTNVDLSNTSGMVITDPASYPVGVTCQYLATPSPHFLITIPGGGPAVPQISSCN
jgi:hypothetical protein